MHYIFYNVHIKKEHHLKLFYFVLLVPIFLCNGMDQSFDDDLHQEMDKVRTSIIAAIETCNRKIDQCKLGISELKDDMRTLKAHLGNGVCRVRPSRR